jgi:putative ABC transport system permease protein
MVIGENLVTALNSLKAHRLRSFLTALGIIIGVTTVVGIFSLTTGLSNTVERQFKSLGTDLISVSRYPWIQTGGSREELRRRKRLKLEDADAIAGLPHVEVVAPTSYAGKRVGYRGTWIGRKTICGTNQHFPYIENYEIEYGMFFTFQDFRRNRDVAVLGWDVAEDLFGGDDPSGKEINIGRRKFLVTGVFKKKGSILGSSLDDQVFIPVSTMFKHYGARNVSLTISAVPTSAADMDRAIEEIRTLMRVRRKVAPDAEDDFAINTSEDLIERFRAISVGAFGVVLGVGGLSLLVGGIGIMNMMLISVTERTREIGIRKAMGARRRQVLQQFVIEAGTLSLLGGLIGIGLGAGIGYLVAATTPLLAEVTWWSILVAVGFSAGIGMFFGVFPAMRAAQVDPIVALRYE